LITPAAGGGERSLQSIVPPSAPSPGNIARKPK
jgi:hypothetical protein